MPSLNISCFQLSLAETDNLDKATNNIDTFFSKNQSTDLIVLSELAITGVNPNKKKSLDKFLPALKDLAKKYDTCQKNGLIVRPILDTVALCPPLIISEKEVDELTDKLKKSLQEAKDEIMKVH